MATQICGLRKQWRHRTLACSGLITLRTNQGRSANDAIRRPGAATPWTISLRGLARTSVSVTVQAAWCITGFETRLLMSERFRLLMSMLAREHLGASTGQSKACASSAMEASRGAITRKQ